MVDTYYHESSSIFSATFEPTNSPANHNSLQLFFLQEVNQAVTQHCSGKKWEASEEWSESTHFSRLKHCALVHNSMSHTSDNPHRLYYIHIVSWKASFAIIRSHKLKFILGVRYLWSHRTRFSATAPLSRCFRRTTDCVEHSHTPHKFIRLHFSLKSVIQITQLIT